VLPSDVSRYQRFPTIEKSNPIITIHTTRLPTSYLY
jgi:hypothetical protein